MTPDLTELEVIQNPALGAFAIWKFGLGFQTDDGRPAAMPLLFLVLPLLLHKQTVQVIESTRRASGLTLFAAKLGEERENLLAVHERALILRKLTLQSLELGIRGGLLTLDYVAATVRANTLLAQSAKVTLPERLKSLPTSADKVGYWFSKAGINQIATTLRVEF
jgi:Family of unknown function (DUF6521)